MLRRNSKKNKEISQKLSEQPTERKRVVKQHYKVVLEPQQTYTIALKHGKTVSLFVDEDGQVYPECFQGAINQSILQIDE